MPGSTLGAPGESTLDGPPERTIPRGFQARMRSRSQVCGWISQSTWCSRRRRAISCVYCAPKSRIRMRSLCTSGGMVRLRSGRVALRTCSSRWARGEAGRLLDAVVRGLLGDDDVVDVALLEPRLRDADEARVAPQLGERRGAAVAHARAHAADQLVDAAAEAAAVRDAAFDALGHGPPRVFHVALEVPVAAALGHRAERAHAAVDLV